MSYGENLTPEQIRTLLDEVGYYNGDKFTHASQVRAFLTIETMTYMFGDDAKLTQNELDQVAKYAIANREHFA